MSEATHVDGEIAAARNAWTQQQRVRSEARERVRIELRRQAITQLGITRHAVEEAFRHCASESLEAAQFEVLNMLDVIRAARREL